MYIVVEPGAPDHLIRRAIKALNYAGTIGASYITVHPDRVAYHDLLSIAFLDDQLVRHGPKVKDDKQNR